MIWNKNRITLLLVSLIIIISATCISCSNGTPSENPLTATKASALLVRQVTLRREQLASPSSERLAQMESLGMRTDNIGAQRIYIYLSQQLTATQVNELRSLNITLYVDSWIPPVANHPKGFLLADMPVDKLDALAVKEYVLKLDTAETKVEPQYSPS